MGDEEADHFLVELDGMIEATDDFIREDEPTEDNDPEGRLKDVAALDHVRKLYLDVFQIKG